jgi:predicted metalloprotease with PDZ domain
MKRQTVALGLICIILQVGIFVVLAKEPASAPQPLGGSTNIIYTMIVNNEDAVKHTAHVRLMVNEPTGSSLTVTFDRQGALLGGPHPITIEDLRAANEKGEELRTSRYSDDGWPSWRVSTQNARSVIIEYDAVLNYYWKAIDAYIGYLGKSFGMSMGLWTFLVPKGFSKSPVLANFSLPTGWSVYAPWDMREGYWYASSLEYFVTSTFALGTYRVLTKQIADTSVSIVVHDKWSRSMQERIADVSFRIFDYYSTFVFLESPLDRYMTIFAPTTDDGKQVGQCEWSSSQGISIAGDFVTGHMVEYAHRVFHIWNVFPPTAMQASNREQDGTWTWWAAEGTAIYYNTRALVDLAYLKGNEILRDDFNRYLREFYGTKNDAPVAQAYRLWDLSTDAYFFITYRKGALVSLLMDVLTRKMTNENKTLDDLMRALYERYGGMKGVYVNKDMIKLLESMTGFDYTLFFSKYVFGKDKLPLKLVPGDLAVDWPELLRALKLSRFPIMTLTLSDSFPKVGQTVKAVAQLATIDSKPISNQTITFYLNSTLVGSTATDQSGLATLTFNVEVDRGTYQLVASYAGSPLFSPTKEGATLTVLPAKTLATATTTSMSTTEVSKEVSTSTVQVTWFQMDWLYPVLAVVVAAIVIVFVARRLRSRP